MSEHGLLQIVVCALVGGAGSWALEVFVPPASPVRRPLQGVIVLATLAAAAHYAGLI